MSRRSSVTPATDTMAIAFADDVAKMLTGLFSSHDNATTPPPPLAIRHIIDALNILGGGGGGAGVVGSSASGSLLIPHSAVDDAVAAAAAAEDAASTGFAHSRRGRAHVASLGPIALTTSAAAGASSSASSETGPWNGAIAALTEGTAACIAAVRVAVLRLQPPPQAPIDGESARDGVVVSAITTLLAAAIQEVRRVAVAAVGPPFSGAGSADAGAPPSSIATPLVVASGSGRPPPMSRQTASPMVDAGANVLLGGLGHHRMSGSDKVSSTSTLRSPGAAAAAGLGVGAHDNDRLSISMRRVTPNAFSGVSSPATHAAACARQFSSTGVSAFEMSVRLGRELTTSTFNDPAMLRASTAVSATESTQSMQQAMVLATSRAHCVEDGAGYATLNQYLVLQELGRGSQGRVFLALDTITNSTRAVKEITKPMSPLHSVRARLESAKHRRAMKREVAIMKRLRHRNIVSLYEVIDDPAHDRLYMVMQYVDRGPISTARGCNWETVDPIQLLDYARQLTAGLVYLHCKGIAHRDIKPDNLLRDEQGNAYLADFGVSALVAAPDDDDEYDGMGREQSSALFPYSTNGGRNATAPHSSGGFLSNECSSEYGGVASSGIGVASPNGQGGEGHPGALAFAAPEMLRPGSYPPPPPPRSATNRRSSRPDALGVIGQQTSWPPATPRPSCSAAASVRHHQPHHLPEADVWALGMSLYAMLYGNLPFDPHDRATYMARVCGDGGAADKIPLPPHPIESAAAPVSSSTSRRGPHGGGGGSFDSRSSTADALRVQNSEGGVTSSSSDASRRNGGPFSPSRRPTVPCLTVSRPPASEGGEAGEESTCGDSLAPHADDGDEGAGSRAGSHTFAVEPPRLLVARPTTHRRGGDDGTDDDDDDDGTGGAAVMASPSDAGAAPSPCGTAEPHRQGTNMSLDDDDEAADGNASPPSGGGGGGLRSTVRPTHDDGGPATTTAVALNRSALEAAAGNSTERHHPKRAADDNDDADSNLSESGFGFQHNGGGLPSADATNGSGEAEQPSDDQHDHHNLVADPSTSLGFASTTDGTPRMSLSSTAVPAAVAATSGSAAATASITTVAPVIEIGAAKTGATLEQAPPPPPTPPLQQQHADPFAVASFTPARQPIPAAVVRRLSDDSAPSTPAGGGVRLGAAVMEHWRSILRACLVRDPNVRCTASRLHRKVRDAHVAVERLVEDAASASVSGQTTRRPSSATNIGSFMDAIGNADRGGAGRGQPPPVDASNNGGGVNGIPKPGGPGSEADDEEDDEDEDAITTIHVTGPSQSSRRNSGSGGLNVPWGHSFEHTTSGQSSIQASGEFFPPASAAAAAAGASNAGGGDPLAPPR